MPTGKLCCSQLSFLLLQGNYGATAMINLRQHSPKTEKSKLTETHIFRICTTHRFVLNDRCEVPSWRKENIQSQKETSDILLSVVLSIIRRWCKLRVKCLVISDISTCVVGRDFKWTAHSTLWASATCLLVAKLIIIWNYM